MTPAETSPGTADRTLIRAGRVFAGTSVVAAVISVGILVVVERGLLTSGVFHLGLWAAGIGSLAWVTITAQARNRVVWALASAAFFAALVTVGVAVFALIAPASILELASDRFFALSPSDLPTWAALAINPLIWAWLPAFFLVLTVVLLWFPDGRPPSPRWRWVGWLSIGLLALASVGATWEYRPASTLPYEAPADGVDDLVLFILLVVAVVGSIAAIIVRYRRSSGVTRHQIRWIAWGGAILGAVMFFLLFEQESTVIEVPEAIILVILGGAELLLILSFWVAITRYRLYDIDVVISKTVTYGALAVFITGVYVLIVVGVGSVIGQGGEPNLALAIVATAAVALLFEPIRSRLQRWANRLVFGERATPYEVLARFSARAATAETDDEVLERIPRLIVDGTGATQATLWTANNGELVAAASWPKPEVSGEADYSVPVEHQGDVLGAITMSSGRGETIAPAEEELVQNLAGGLGLALRNARLTDDLRDQVEELAASRERILTAADEARRDLERDLDMGPQQELVAVKVKLGVVKSRAKAENAIKTAEVIGQLEDDTGAAIESVRDFARGVYPPLLEGEGLVVAVSAEGDKSALPVTIQAKDVGRYPREIETAVFFSILESLQNAAKYSGATAVSVTIRDDGDRLGFQVSDDGRGFDPTVVNEGSGISSMTDRLDAAGGTLTIDSVPGRGTTVQGSMPATSMRIGPP